ncbi:carbohydrate-binding protein [Rubellicoccus peritrichatus]|uniref:Carbohydrate-binding protein n=1 Tax=Rubellicoccus peritrichatus TaxID=3080537 RepID=A0AAQ3LCH6_9BACT|nr:carbohydrate-binding protein [Puniceicoccus sp. CR14]WOO41023.1 carbohydrate-binding protein [Puniceicoccus sp. CR14]
MNIISLVARKALPCHICFGLLVVLSICFPGRNHLKAIPGSIANDYNLVFEDDFNGNALDPMNWFIAEGPRKGAINVTDSVEVSGGYLTISTYTADNQPGNLNDVHHTGFVSSANRILHPFGYFEVRVRFDQGEVGAWHAFWLMPGGTTPNWGDNPDAETGAEIDIFEYRDAYKNDVDLSDSIHYGLHWNGYYGGRQKAENPVVYPPLTAPSLLDGQFHTYAVLRTPQKYEFYFDDVKLWETTEGVSHAYSNLLLTSEVSDPTVGGHYWFAGYAPDGGYGAKGASTNPKFTVDWVRVYNLDKSVSGQAPYGVNQIPGAIEAEDFDLGGKGVSYFDKNDSGPGSDTSYRAGESVDISSDLMAGNGHYVSDPTTNEWLEYTLDPSSAGVYSVLVDVARLQDATNNADNGIMLFYADGEELGQIRIDETGGWTSWHRQSLPFFANLSGNPVFTVRFENTRDVNFDCIHFDYLGNAYDMREAEDGITSLAIMNSDLASGGSYLSGFGSVGNTETLQLDNVEGFTNGGDVMMTVRYAWSQSNPNKSTGVKVKVNGAYLQANGADLLIPFTNTRSWNMYNNVSLILPSMVAGPNNTVVLESDGVSNQNIRLDSVIFTVEETISGGGEILVLEGEDPSNLLLGNTGNTAYIGYHNNAQNGAYVSGFNKSSAGVEWSNLNLSSGGAAQLTIHYANGSTNITKTLEVNGVAQDLVFPPTTAWNDFTGSIQTTIQLNGDGTDDIRLWRKHNTSGDAGNLRVDYIVVETTAAAATIDLTEEAEGHEFGQAITGTHATASGGAYVDRLNKSASGVEWTGLQAPADMQATLTVAYANGSGSDSLKMLVVNGVSQLVQFPVTSGWNDFSGTLTLPVDLVEGANTIRLWRDGAGIDALRVDYIQLAN